MRTFWQDEVKDQNGNIIQPGTPISARNMNSLETRTENNKNAVLQLIQRNLQNERTIKRLEGRTTVIDLQNSKNYPFNNSTSLVTLDESQDDFNYSVYTEVIESDGEVGKIIVFDKQLNGFKIKFTGSAKEVKARVHIRGGK